MSPNRLRHVERAHHELKRGVLQVGAAEVRFAEVAARQVAELKELELDSHIQRLSDSRQGTSCAR